MSTDASSHRASPRTLAIGDIHGCFAHLDTLLTHLAPAPHDHLIFLGDLVDRGQDSVGVLTRVIELAQHLRITNIMGNHEQMMLAARRSPAMLDTWLDSGGDAALRSYGAAAATLANIPPEHWLFLENQLVPYLETDTHIFVHASAYPDMPIAEQPDYMLRWERSDDVAPHDSGKILICGHTPQRSGRPMNRGYAICLDTNACRGGPLTGMDLGSGKVWQARADGTVEIAHISAFEED